MTTHSPAPAPPDAASVAARALCLSSLVVRGILESSIVLSPAPADADGFRGIALTLSRWLNEQDFTGFFTLSELDSLSAAPGQWDPAEHDRHPQRVEATGVLLWALSLRETLPAWHEPFPPLDLQPLIGWPTAGVLSPKDSALGNFPYNGADLLSGLIQLRPQPVIAMQRSAAECWRWRCEVARRSRSEPANGDYAQMIGIAAEEAHAAGATGRPVGRDFPIGIKPFSSLTEAQQGLCATVVAARQTALDWLCGYATPWDAVAVAA